MIGDHTKHHVHDPVRINLHDPREITYWTQALGVTREALRDTVHRVGVMADDVRRAIRRR